jgi:hypothetical protein
MAGILQKELLERDCRLFTLADCEAIITTVVHKAGEDAERLAMTQEEFEDNLKRST